MSQEYHLVFGSGPSGLAVVDSLLAKGKHIRLINRRGQADVHPDVEMMAGDATDPNFIRQAASDAVAVYNCTNAPYTDWPEIFPRLQSGVLEGAAAAGAKLVVMENLYMFGPTGGKPLTENLPYAATTRKGRTRARMTEQLFEAHQQGKVRMTIGRASDYFGPGAIQSAAGERLFRPALAGKSVQVMGNPDMPHTYSYIEDIGRALVVLGEQDRALGEAWNLPNPQTVTTRQFAQMVASEAGRTARIQAVPKIMIRVMGLFNKLIHELDEMTYEFEEPFIVNSEKFEAAFGMTATPLAEAIRKTAAWYLANPEN